MRMSEKAIGPFDFFGVNLDRECNVCPVGDCDCIIINN